MTMTTGMTQITAKKLVNGITLTTFNHPKLGKFYQLTDPRTRLSVNCSELGGRVWPEFPQTRAQDSPILRLSPFDPDALPDMAALLDKPRDQVRWNDFLPLGGGSTKIAPQGDWKDNGESVPYQDLNIGIHTMSETPDGLVLTSPECRETKLRTHREVIMRQPGSGEFGITSYSDNNGKTRKFSPWDIFPFLNPARIVVGPVSGKPQVYHEHGAVPEGVIAPSGEEGYFIINLTPDTPKFKVGFRFTENVGVFAIRFPGTDILLVESFRTLEGTYAHFGPAELYQGGPSFEAEALARQAEVPQGGSSEKVSINCQLSHFRAIPHQLGDPLARLVT